MKAIRRILVATDFTSASVPAFRQAVELARKEGAQLSVAHAYMPPSILQMGGYVAAGAYEEWDEIVRKAVSRKLQELVEEARKKGVDARPLVLAGTAFEAIVQAAQENDSDLVIMGTHGRTGVSRFFLGSVASRVISTAPCPVMTVRAA